MLEAFSQPRGVAVVGASPSPGKLGHAVLQNVIQYGYKGPVYPINPTAKEILGLPAYPTVGDIPGPVDLAVVLVPAKAVPGVIEECGQKGIGGAVVISAGFREVGREGRQLEQQLLENARRYNMRIVGPNVLGIIDTVAGLNASFAAGMPRQGRIAFMSQSGALCTSILDMALGQGIGFSRFYSIGNKADLNEIDFLRASRGCWGSLLGITGPSLGLISHPLSQGAGASPICGGGDSVHPVHTFTRDGGFTAQVQPRKPTRGIAFELPTVDIAGTATNSTEPAYLCRPGK